MSLKVTEDLFYLMIKYSINILGILGWLTSDVVVRKAAEKTNNFYAIIIRQTEKNASIADTRNVNYLQEWRRNGSLAGVIEELRISNDRISSKEKTEKTDGNKAQYS